MDDLLRHPAEFTSELIRNISDRASNPEGDLSLERLGNGIARVEIDEGTNEMNLYLWNGCPRL
jgi:hypothetical protein